MKNNYQTDYKSVVLNSINKTRITTGRLCIYLERIF